MTSNKLQNLNLTTPDPVSHSSRDSGSQTQVSPAKFSAAKTTTTKTPATITPAIEIRGLTKSYGPNQVLAGIDLTVAPGQVYGVLGPNGAGKTTLIRILSTLIRHDSGFARIAGIDVATNQAGVRTKIGLVGQNAAVDEILNGRQNLEMFGRLYHLGAARARSRAVELLEQFDLVEAATKPVSQYSGGMRRRLDLAAGLILRPDVIFLDEPTTGLDPRSRTEVWDSVRALTKAGTTVLLTTQYLDEADQLCGRICLIDNGKVVSEGTPDELKANIGGDRLDIVISDSAQLAQAAKLIAPFASVAAQAAPGAQAATTSQAGADSHDPAAIDTVTTNPDLRLLSLPVDSRIQALDGAMRALGDAAIAIDDISLRRPTLDEVFMHLTGQAPEASNSAA